MKKVFLTLTVVASLCITSCNKDDDSQDKIIGTWTLLSESRTENGQTTNDTLTDCEKTSFITFSADGVVSSKHYYLDGDVCLISSEDIGTWKNLGDNIYETTFDGTTIQNEISFSGNTFTFNDVDGDSAFMTVFQKQ